MNQPQSVLTEPPPVDLRRRTRSRPGADGASG